MLSLVRNPEDEKRVPGICPSSMCGLLNLVSTSGHWPHLQEARWRIRRQASDITACQGLGQGFEWTDFTLPVMPESAEMSEVWTVVQGPAGDEARQQSGPRFPYYVPPPFLPTTVFVQVSVTRHH